ncbi:AraC family transcriptional regulator [Planomicrobium chinense]|uniref:AraC family transcriptional regulator n=1 Tax=Planococcus chinensis TaxID=272917 RepID=UPI001CC55ED0|nr:AraC family transcriptional regulator [Planococcus chinensis]MBZ5201883.1 AraC family transcriptional regulator [Planococcus chinensis]
MDPNHFQLPFIFHSADMIHCTSDRRHIKPLHVHPESCEIILVLEGQSRFSINQKTYTATAGSLVLCNAGDWHAEASVKGQAYSCLSLNCSGHLVKQLEMNQVRAHHAAPVQQPAEFERLKTLVLQLIEENSSSYANKQQTVALFLELFFEVLERSLNEPLRTATDHRQLIRMAKRFIEENAHRALTLELFSTEIGLSKYYLAHVFKEQTGMSPIQYAIQCRIQLARYLLQHTDASIRQIAQRTGYKSETHFQQAFKKATGQTPGKYRTATKETHNHT